MIRLAFIIQSFLWILPLGCSSQPSLPLYDTTINSQLILRDNKSIEKSIGDVMQKLDTIKDLPDVYFVNTLGTESLRLIFYPGDTKNTISSFEVLSVDYTDKVQKLWPTSFASFTTESGIKLGMTKEEIVKIKGRDFKVTNSGAEVVLEYVTDEKEDTGFLKRYNMPSYFAKYIFQYNRLIRFAFGFDYP